MNDKQRIIEEHMNAFGGVQKEKTTEKEVQVTDRNDEPKSFVRRVVVNFSTSDASSWWFCLIIFTSLSLFTRLLYIHKPNNVVWDETHFGKMVSWYINGTYFSDVHPSGGKLLLTFFGWLSGYNGTHPFSLPGISYEGYQGILGIRIGGALLGATTVPVSFYTVWLFTKNLTSAVIAAMLVLTDIGSMTLTKFILLDSPLFFFMMLSLMGMGLIHHCTIRWGAFSPAWWMSLSFTGAMLGLLITVKFVGLFTVALVGVYTLHSLWILFSRTAWMDLLKHFLARVLTLIVVPMSIYLLMFVIHDSILYKTRSSTGGEESSLSPEFQMQLEGSQLNGMNYSKDVVYGSLITLRTDMLAGPILHSHNQTYPVKSVPGNLQQVTGYKARDHNNLFRVLFPTDDPEMSNHFYAGAPEYLTNGDVIRLHHPLTNASLAVSNESSPVTKKLLTVYAEPYIINTTFPEEEDDTPIADEALEKHLLWKVVVDDTPLEANITVLGSRLNLINVKYKCALVWTEQALPKAWIEGQDEIGCTKNWKQRGTVWRVETQFNPYLENETVPLVSNYTILDRFVETHQIQRYTNSRFIPTGEDKYGPLAHRPWMWPICYKSQPWYDVNYRIVLLGNPFVFWMNLLGIIGVMIHLVMKGFKTQRKQLPADKGEENFDFWCKMLLLGYLFNYLPFFAMSRIVYFHHYFPSLLMSCILTGVFFGHFIQKMSPGMNSLMTLLVCSFLAVTFILYCGVGYGIETEGPFHLSNSTFKSLRLIESWYI